MLIQIIVTLFIGFAVSRVMLRFRSKEFSLGEFLFWMVIWAGIETVLWIPKLLDEIAQTIGIGRGIDAVVYGTIVFLFYMMYRLYAKTKTLELEVAEIVGRMALQDVKNNVKK